MNEELKDDQQLHAKWCYDSETGERSLIELATGKVLIHERADGTWELRRD